MEWPWSLYAACWYWVAILRDSGQVAGGCPLTPLPEPPAYTPWRGHPPKRAHEYEEEEEEGGGDEECQHQEQQAEDEQRTMRGACE